MINFFILILIWNAVVMLIYGIDKGLARMGKRRVSEDALLLCAFLLGGCGAMFGMVVFNHKTSKMKFRILVPLTVAISVAAVYWLGKEFIL